LQDLALPHPEMMTSKEKRRLKHYFYGTTYLSIIFCSLRGKTRSLREKHLFTNLAALAYFFDDLTDAFRNRDDSGIIWQDNPEQYGRSADERGLALHFLHNIYAALPPDDLSAFREYMHHVFNIETAGRQQSDSFFENNKLIFNELYSITSEKGGYSVLMFRRVLAHPLSAAEQEALFQFGALIQLCDDIFDVWFDLQEGTVTLATHFAQTKDIDSLQSVFDRQVNAVTAAFRQLSGGEYTSMRVETTLRIIHFIVSITRVCLKHYADLIAEQGALPLHDRKQMVVDMERWKNRIRAAVAVLTPLS
jgi:hypothetical protein